MGGLGNQMFQYALGRRISLLRNTTLKVDVSFLNDTALNHTSRNFELNVFSSDIAVASETDISKFNDLQNSKLKRGIRQILPFVFPYYIIGEPSNEYNSQILNSPKNSLLIGFWQTEKYFLSIQETIRKDFTFKTPLSGVNNRLAESMEACNSVGVHIRRGDYVHNPETNRYHGSCSPEYYYKAIEEIKNKIENVRLYIFSDDLHWVKENMKFDVPVTYIDNNSGINSYLDMQLMSLCKHNIIANSSFSWWAAWLNANPEKMVIAPARWFNDSAISVKDIIPEGWQKI